MRIENRRVFLLEVGILALILILAFWLHQEKQFASDPRLFEQQCVTYNYELAMDTRGGGSCSSITHPSPWHLVIFESTIIAGLLITGVSLFKSPPLPDIVGNLKEQLVEIQKGWRRDIPYLAAIGVTGTLITAVFTMLITGLNYDACMSNVEHQVEDWGHYMEGLSSDQCESTSLLKSFWPSAFATAGVQPGVFYDVTTRSGLFLKSLMTTMGAIALYFTTHPGKFL